MSPLKAKAVWTEKGAVGRFTADNHIFHLRRNSDSYTLFAVQETGERELVRLNQADPQFTNRILVAIGDSLSSR